MLYAADFREKARAALYGNWGKAVGVGFVASLLGAATLAAGSGGGSGRGSNNSGTTSGAEMGFAGSEAYEGMTSFDFSNIDSIADLNGIIPVEYQVGFMVLLSVLSFIGIVFTILHLPLAVP